MVLFRNFKKRFRLILNLRLILFVYVRKAKISIAQRLPSLRTYSFFTFYSKEEESLTKLTNIWPRFFDLPPAMQPHCWSLSWLLRRTSNQLSRCHKRLLESFLLLNRERKGEVKVSKYGRRAARDESLVMPGAPEAFYRFTWN